jgi:hypothetical protein
MGIVCCLQSGRDHGCVPTSTLRPPGDAQDSLPDYSQSIQPARSSELNQGYNSRHQIACFKATEGLHPLYCAALSQQYSVVSFATLRVLSCLYSPGLCSCCNVVRFCCDSEACNLVTAILVHVRQVVEYCTEIFKD